MTPGRARPARLYPPRMFRHIFDATRGGKLPLELTYVRVIVIYWSHVHSLEYISLQYNKNAS